jgi:hypothetical protein
MAGDNTSPKVRMLLTIGIVTLSILVAVKFVLESYYVDMTESYEQALLPQTTEIDTMRAAQRDHLDKGAIPVSVAMETLATKGRDNASPDIVPQPSDDPSPLIGWAQIQHTGPMPTLAPIPTAPPEGAADGGAAETTGDAGTAPTIASDAGATQAVAGDAAAPHPAVVHDGGAPAPHAPAAKDGGH